MSSSPVVDFRLGDIVRLSRQHPCGGSDWLVDRIGADIGLRCLGCGRHVLLERRALERRLVTFVRRGDEELTRAAAPRPADEVPATTRARPVHHEGLADSARQPNDETLGR